MVTMPHPIIFIAATYSANLGFVFFTGFRRHDQGGGQAMRPFGDALETTTLVILATGVTLTLLWNPTLATQAGTGAGRDRRPDRRRRIPAGTGSRDCQSCPAAGDDKIPR